MARVLLFQAAVHDTHVERGHPLGLMSLASHLARERGDEVRIHDMRLAWKRFDLPVEAFRSFRPDVVGIGAHGVDAPAMHRLAALVKAASPETPVVLGGIHATSYWKEVLEDPNVDCVVIGEGEVTFREWLDAVESKAPTDEIPGTAFRSDGEGVRTAARVPETDLDIFPFPAWDLLEIDAYARFPRAGIFYRSPRYMSIETARGCPYKCAWCHRSMGERFRPHSPGYVVSLLEELKRDYGVDDFLIVDDMFNLDDDRMTRIFTGVLEKGLDVGFSLPIGIRADIITDDALALMRRAGVYKIMIAVETASPRLQREMGKKLDLERTLAVIRKASDLGISTHGNFMIGLPSETEAEMWSTLKLAARSRLDTFGFYRAIPFKGTRLHEMANLLDGEGRQREDAFSFWDLDVNLSEVPIRKLNFIRRLAYPYFCFRPGRLRRIFAHLPNPSRLLPFLVWFFLKKAVSK